MKQAVFDFIGFIVFDLQNFFSLAQVGFFICSPVIRAPKIIVKSSVPTLTTT